jgi:hypothetical protein
MSFSSANVWVQNISGLTEQGKPSLLSRQMNSIAPNSPCRHRPRILHQARPILDLPIG